MGTAAYLYFGILPYDLDRWPTSGRGGEPPPRGPGLRGTSEH